MDFIVLPVPNRPDTMMARYDCACGCKPNAEYERGSAEAGYEHCCCGNVHFLGPQAMEQLTGYLAERQSQGMDEEVGGYSTFGLEVAAPWGGAVPLAYALPHHPKQH